MIFEILILALLTDNFSRLNNFNMVALSIKRCINFDDWTFSEVFVQIPPVVNREQLCSRYET